MSNASATFRLCWLHVGHIPNQFAEWQSQLVNRTTWRMHGSNMCKQAAPSAFNTTAMLNQSREMSLCVAVVVNNVDTAGCHVFDPIIVATWRTRFVLFDSWLHCRKLVPELPSWWILALRWPPKHQYVNAIDQLRDPWCPLPQWYRLVSRMSNVSPNVRIATNRQSIQPCILLSVCWQGQQQTAETGLWCGWTWTRVCCWPSQLGGEKH